MCEQEYFLWYDNGTGWFDCASAHETLEEAIVAACTGWQPDQYITRGTEDIVWRSSEAGQPGWTGAMR